MGKTEFLLKDITPCATQQGFLVFYFSFLDASKNAKEEFLNALEKFSESSLKQSKKQSKKRKLLAHVKKIAGSVGKIKAEIELSENKQTARTLIEIFSSLIQHKQVVLLLDEVQALTKYKSNEEFVATLRTALDLNKDNIKTIFTGSSQTGLQRMFSEANAPFFHFGQNLPFPSFEQSFTDHLATLYMKITGKSIDAEQLWQVFQEMEKVPQLARSLVERLILHPNKSLLELKETLLQNIYDARAFVSH